MNIEENGVKICFIERKSEYRKENENIEENVHHINKYRRKHTPY